MIFFFSCTSLYKIEGKSNLKKKKGYSVRFLFPVNCYLVTKNPKCFNSFMQRNFQGSKHGLEIAMTIQRF